jgi:hypothetical protein
MASERCERAEHREQLSEQTLLSARERRAKKSSSSLIGLSEHGNVCSARRATSKENVLLGSARSARLIMLVRFYRNK